MNGVAVQAQRRPRIAFLNNQGLASTGGGVTILRRLVTDLADDHDVCVLSHDPPAQTFAGVRQVSIVRPPPPERLWRLAPLLRARHLAQTVPRGEVETADLVVALDCHFAPLLRHTRPRRLIYLSLSCIPRQEWFGTAGLQAVVSFPQYAWLERSAASCADAVLVSSHMHGAELRRFEAMPRLTPVVLHPVFASPKPAVPPAERGVPTILSAGRLEPVKNYAAVIDIATRLRDLPCRFIVAGNGPLEAALRQQVIASDVADKVTFCGSVADLGPLLAQASLFLHPSRYESFGIAVFEAMQAGVPPIVGRHTTAGYHEVLADGIDSCRVDFAQPDHAAAAIRLLLTDHAKRLAMGVAARQAAARALSRDYVASFRALVRQLLSERLAEEPRPAMLAAVS